MPYLGCLCGLLLPILLIDTLVNRWARNRRLPRWLPRMLTIILAVVPCQFLAFLGYNLGSGTHGVWFSSKRHLDVRYGSSDFYWVSLAGKRQSNLQLRNTPRTLMLLQDNQPIAEGTLNWNATELAVRPVRPNSIVPQTTTLKRQYLDH
jgi:hypothetical protein